MTNLTRKKIVVAICLLISSFLLVVFRQYSFFEIVISWVGIVIITVPPHLLLSRYFTSIHYPVQKPIFRFQIIVIKQKSFTFY